MALGPKEEFTEIQIKKQQSPQMPSATEHCTLSTKARHRRFSKGQGILEGLFIEGPPHRMKARVAVV